MRWLKKLRWRLGFRRVVRLQVRTGVPVETRATFDRLVAAGLSERDVFRLLDSAYEAEVAAMLLGQRVYDHAEFVRVLEGLPRAPDVSLDDVGRAGRCDLGPGKGPPHSQRLKPPLGKTP